MIKVQHTRNGGWSTSAIFNEVKQHANLRHAIKASSRDWWRAEMRRWGDCYQAAWLPHQAQSGPYEWPAGWIVATKTWDYMLQNMFSHVRKAGGNVVMVWLAWPHDFKTRLSEEFGVQCDFCGSITHTWKWEPRFLCDCCEHNARRAGGVEKMLASAVLNRARRILREEKKRAVAGRGK